MNNKIKEHRLNQLGNIKLTARQKNRVGEIMQMFKDAHRVCFIRPARHYQLQNTLFCGSRNRK